MKPLIKIVFALVSAYAMAAGSVFAQVYYTFDEYGNSTGPGILPGSRTQPDPSGANGLPVPVLVYNLSFSVIPGDVVLTEPGSPGGSEQYSDIVRFWTPPAGGSSQIIFYSDVSADDPPDAPADTGLPAQLINPVFIPEVGPEGNNGAVYAPTANEPGFVLYGLPPVPAVYNIISDVPEPKAFVLAALGSGLLLFVLKRQYRTSANQPV